MTLLFYQIEPYKNGVSLIFPSSLLDRYSLEPKTERIFEILWGILEIIQFILNILMDKYLDEAWDYMFWIKSIEVIHPPKKLNYMQGLKSAILATFQKRMAMPC